MVRYCRSLIWMIMTLSVLTRAGLATPSTQIWNPSTDVQPLKTWHLGIDNYFSTVSNDTKPYAFPTDIGLTYGLFNNLEVGIDLMEPSADPLLVNAKYAIAEGSVLPALAVGGFNFGTKKDVADYNMIYGVMSKSFNPAGRFSLGYYSGLNEKLFLDEKGNPSESGLIVSWDKAVTEKVWLSVDYSSGQSWYGSFSLGGSYTIAPGVSLLAGYVIFNNSDPKVNTNNLATTQIDINF